MLKLRSYNSLHSVHVVQSFGNSAPDIYETSLAEVLVRSASDLPAAYTFSTVGTFSPRNRIGHYFGECCDLGFCAHVMLDCNILLVVSCPELLAVLT